MTNESKPVPGSTPDPITVETAAGPNPEAKAALAEPPPTRLDRLRVGLGLERNILVVLAIILILGVGEEMWLRFIPIYLKVLGASGLLIGVYGTISDLLDSVYQYPGGWLADRLGRRASLMLFTWLSIIGYFLYLVSPSWPMVMVGLFFMMSWHSLTLPALFAVIGDSLPPARRAIGFGVQSIWRRVPTMIGPPLAGFLIVTLGVKYGPDLGVKYGVRIGLAVTIVLALVSLFIVRRFYIEKAPPPPDDKIGVREMWHLMDPRLKRLLVADCLARWAEGIPKTFIILYVVHELGRSELDYGWLDGTLRVVVATLSYLPLIGFSERLNRKPFVLLTFLFFALFPLVLVSSYAYGLLVLAFGVAGLREIGEPARKAMIVDLAKETLRGRAIGVYYLIRGMVVFPASLVGGLLWKFAGHQWPFYAAFAVGMAGFFAYWLFGPSDQEPSQVQPTPQPAGTP